MTLDRHAPLKRRKVPDRIKLAWFSDEIATAIRKRRKAERRWYAPRSDTTRFMEFYRAQRMVRNLLDEAERNYYKTQFQDNSQNLKKIFGICNGILGRKRDLPLPPGYTEEEQAERFNKFFITKITNIHENLRVNPTQYIIAEDHINPPSLTKFKELKEHDIIKLINQSPTKSCELDPIPTAILKEVLPSIGPLFTSVVNESLQTGVFPQDLKEALVKPLLKKANLELIDKNYQPVSNLEFMGETIEQAVTSQLTQHISENSFLEPMQSAYRSGHSTETALLRVKTDLLQAIDCQEVVCLILLDRSSAFDTVDHCLLLQRLEVSFGIKETALEWIRSYLTGRTQRVSVGKVTSSPIVLSFGVPQGSVLGPILFTLCTSPLGSICIKHDINYHMYADDQQIYLSFKPSKAGDKENYIKRLEMCISEIKEWMIVNKLKLNEDKMEFIVFGTKQQLSKIGEISINIGSVQVQPVDHVRNLG